LTLAIAAILAALAFGTVQAGPNDGRPDDWLPPGLAVRTFIHYPRGHDRPAEVESAVCDDSSPSACGDFAIATTGSGLPIRWADPTGGGEGIPYYVMTNFSTRKSPSLSASAAAAAIDASFSPWEVASDAGLNYTNAGTLSKASIPRLDGKNVVGWKGINATALAVTNVWYYTSSGYIAEFDLIFNNAYSWSVTAPVLANDGDPGDGTPYEDPENLGPAGTYDVRSIGTHEVGHTVMLLDLYDPSHGNLTMYGYGAATELKKLTLALGDDAGVDATY
jgi:hypothetical protein